MTLTQILRIGVGLICVGLLLGLFGMLVLAWRIDKSFDELRDFPLSEDCKYYKEEKGGKNEKRK